jgi:hypothetical protein
MFQLVISTQVSDKGIGIIKAISTSKIKKRIAIIKNCLDIFLFFSVCD